MNESSPRIPTEPLQTIGSGNYRTFCEHDECAVKVDFAISINGERPKYVFIDMADSHGSDRLQCDMKFKCV